MSVLASVALPPAWLAAVLLLARASWTAAAVLHTLFLAALAAILALVVLRLGGLTDGMSTAVVAAVAAVAALVAA